MKKKIIIIFFVSVIVILGILFLFKESDEAEEQKEDFISDKFDFTDNGFGNNVDNNSLDIEKEQKKEEKEKKKKELTEPIAKFEKRITKKPFGIYIDPASSPVQPEKFQGYHTGVDVEYNDVENEAEVVSMADGKIILSKWVSGYGGLLVISHNINSESIISLYGHLDPDSLMSVDNEVKVGDKIGVLGNGGTNETDYERKHLHFGIIKGDKIDLKGYVKSREELNKWYEPVGFLKQD